MAGRSKTTWKKREFPELHQKSLVFGSDFDNSLQRGWNRRQIVLHFADKMVSGADFARDYGNELK